jgi:hypothetical protein
MMIICDPSKRYTLECIESDKWKSHKVELYRERYGSLDDLLIQHSNIHKGRSFI